MKYIAALVLILIANMAQADVAADIHACIDDIDRSVSDMQSQPLDKRIVALKRYVEDESQCFSQLNALCMLDEPSEPCLEAMLTTLNDVLETTAANLPTSVEGEGKLQADYKAWHEKLQNGEAIAPASTCSLPSNYPKQACDVLAISTTVIEARSWQRNLDILATAQAQAEN